MKHIAIIQSSLREGSHTSIVCKELQKRALDRGLIVNYIDLREVEMEFCDGRDLDKYTSDLQQAYKIIDDAEVIIFGMPVYQYSMSGVLKNFIDVCGGAVKGKQIGAIINAGGPNCYMASSDLFNCLFYEYGCQAIMPTPYSWSNDFNNGEIVNSKVLEKLTQLADTILERI